MNDSPIGIFDSGLGGLTVAGAIFARLPHDSTLYVGDTARVPYGPKSPQTVRRYSLEILQWLLGQGVKAVVVACNTSTAHALASLEAASPVPVIGVIEPGARAAHAAAERAGAIGVIGTAGTIASRAYERALLRLDPSRRVLSRACPLFVPLVEEGWFDHPATELVAREYLAGMGPDVIRALVLGCTHYPLLKPLLGRLLGPEVALIDSAEETARAVAEALEARALTASPGSAPQHRFAVTDDPERFRAIGTRFLGERLGEVEVIPLS